MGRLLNTLRSRQNLPVDTINLSQAENFDDDDDRGKGKIYDPNYVPPGGWDPWCEWASEQGKIAHIVHSRAKNAMSFKLVGNTKPVQTALDETFRKIHFRSQTIGCFAHRDVFGRTLIEPVWKTIDNQKVDLTKVKRLDPQTIRIFWDTEKDVIDLKEYLKDTDHASYAASLKAGLGDTIIGYVQNWGMYEDENLTSTRAVFFRPGELIFIPRHPSSRNPGGLSLLRQNYVLIMNKFGIEKDQAIMARRHGDPKHKFIIPATLWDKRDEVKKELKKGIRAGLDFFFKGRTDPSHDRMDVELVEPKGNPAAVFRAQDHLEDQFNAAMGWADSFTESKSSNRSVGYIQLAFFERNLAPEREIFAEILMDQLIEPWLKARGLPPGSVEIQFEDLTPEDRIEKARIMAPLIPYMPAAIVKQFLEEMGFQIPDDGGGGTDPLVEGEMGPEKEGNLLQDPEVQEAHELVQMLRGDPCAQSPLDPRIPDAIRWYHAAQRRAEHRANYATQKGVPKTVLKGGRAAREQFREEVEALKEDIEDVLGL